MGKRVYILAVVTKSSEVIGNAEGREGIRGITENGPERGCSISRTKEKGNDVTRRRKFGNGECRTQGSPSMVGF